MRYTLKREHIVNSNQPITISELGHDSGQGNLLGVQPFLLAADYRSGETLASALDAYLRAAREKGWLNPRSIVVFPEYTGTWLVAADEKDAVTGAKTLNAAMLALILAHPLGFARRWKASGEKGRIEAALFRLKAHDMAAAYNAVFSSLAREYAVTIVAGSTLLPGARVVSGRVEAGETGAPLQNVSAVFRPDGSAYLDLARKCFPIAGEQAFTSAAQATELPVFDTPAGRLGVLVCADSWFPQAHAALARQDIDLLAVPSFINHSGAWGAPWGGYSGWPDAADIDPGDIGRLSEGQAWEKYALAGRLASSGAQAGVNVFLQGELWDIRTDGHSVIVQGDEKREIQAGQAGLVNVWIESR